MTPFTKYSPKKAPAGLFNDPFYKIFQKKKPAGLLNDPFYKIFWKKRPLRVDFLTQNTILSARKAPAGLFNDPFYKIFQKKTLRDYLMTPFTKYSKKRPLRVDLRSFLQIIYDIGTEFLIFHCFATKMLLLFCKSMIPVRFCTVFPLHSCAGIKTRFKALLKTQYLTLGPNF